MYYKRIFMHTYYYYLIIHIFITFSMFRAHLKADGVYRLKINDWLHIMERIRAL